MLHVAIGWVVLHVKHAIISVSDCGSVILVVQVESLLYRHFALPDAADRWFLHGSHPPCTVARLSFLHSHKLLLGQF